MNVKYDRPQKILITFDNEMLRIIYSTFSILKRNIGVEY